MPVYKIYHQNALLLEVVAHPSQAPMKYSIHLYGIELMELPTGYLTLSCPLEDVRVEKDGNPATLRLLYTFTIDDLVTRYSTSSIETFARYGTYSIEEDEQ